MGTTCLATQPNTFPWGPSLLLPSRELWGSGGHGCLTLVGVSEALLPEGPLLSLSSFSTGMPSATGSSLPTNQFGTTAWAHRLSETELTQSQNLLQRRGWGPRSFNLRVFVLFCFYQINNPCLPHAGGLWARWQKSGHLPLVGLYELRHSCPFRLCCTHCLSRKATGVTI